MLRLTKDCIDELLEIEKQCFGASAWNKNMLLGDFDNPVSSYWGMFDNGVLMGYCSVMIILDECHITNIAVRPCSQGKGYGKNLLKFIEKFAIQNKAYRVTLEVNTGNVIALKMYLSNGYEIAGVRHNYYPVEETVGRDAYVMWKTINE